MRDPREALDYPSIDDDKFLAWMWNRLPWPDARRYVGYLTNRRHDAMTEAPLFSSSWQEAELFDTAQEAHDFVEDAALKRGHPGGPVFVSDVWYLKRLCGYAAPTPEERILMTRTGRGFEIGHFTDRYDVKCSIQKSSLATEDAIWLGPDHPDPKILIEGKGWQPAKLPDGCITNTRMHLTREQVIELLPLLTRFAQTGDLT